MASLVLNNGALTILNLKTLLVTVVHDIEQPRSQHFDTWDFSLPNLNNHKNLVLSLKMDIDFC